MKKPILCLLFLKLVTVLPAMATTIEQMAPKLLELRAEVESKGQELAQARKLSTSELETMVQRRAELEALIAKENLRRLQLSEKQTQATKNAQGTKGSQASDQKELLAWAERLEKTIAASLPFMRSQRLKTIANLKTRISEGEENPIALARELWRVTEDEFKLAANNEFVISKLDFFGETKDAEIARIGMMQMIFVTAKGEAGYAQRETDGQWNLVRATSDQESTAIRRTLAKFKNKESSGWFELPGLNLRGERSL